MKFVTVPFRVVIYRDRMLRCRDGRTLCLRSRKAILPMPPRRILVCFSCSRSFSLLSSSCFLFRISFVGCNSASGCFLVGFTVIRSNQGALCSRPPARPRKIGAKFLYPGAVLRLQFSDTPTPLGVRKNIIRWELRTTHLQECDSKGVAGLRDNSLWLVPEWL